MQALMDDAYRFAQYFANSINQHPLQVYATALPFTPINTTLYCHFHNHSQLPLITRGGQESWSPLLLAIRDISKCTCIVFSPDGTRVLCGTSDRTFHVHDVATGAMIFASKRTRLNYLAPCPVNCTFSPDGSWIVSVHYQDNQLSLYVWSSSSGEQTIEPLHIGPFDIGDELSTPIVSPDGLLIACSSHSTIHVWNANSGVKVTTAVGDQQHSPSVLAFSPDSKRIVAGSSKGTVSSWDSILGVEVLGPLRGHNGRILSIYVTSDGGQIFSIATDSQVRIWDAMSGANTFVSSLQGPSQILAAAFSVDGRQLLLRTYDRAAGGAIGVWDPLSGMQTLRIAADVFDYSPAVAWSPCGKVIASAEKDYVGLWDTAVSAKPLVNTRKWKRCDALSYSSDGTRIAFAISEHGYAPIIIIIDAMTGEEIYEPLQGHRLSITAVVFCSDGLLIASCSNDDTIRIWDATNGATICAITELEDAVQSIAFSPDGQRIVSGSCDTIRVWDAKSGAALLGPFGQDDDMILSVGYSPDGTRIVSGSTQHNVYVWDAASGAQILGPLEGGRRAYAPNSVGFSPDGSKIGFRSLYLEQWDATTGTGIETISPRVACKCGVFDRFVVDCDNMWITDVTTGFALSCPPLAMANVILTTSSQTSVAFATDTELYVMHFPVWMLTS